jgi:hypothetical protein
MKRFRVAVYTERRAGNHRVPGEPLREYYVIAASGAQADEMVRVDVEADLRNLPYTMDRTCQGRVSDESAPRLSRVT